MDALSQIRRLRAHAVWADDAILGALRAAPHAAAAWREYAHVLGAEATWLARLEGRPSTVAIWPELASEEVDALRAANARGMDAYVSRLDEADLDATVSYRNSAGASFTTAVGDILLHAALHAQYHRGKVNAMLREAGAAPAPADYIGFVRGVPAPVTRMDPGPPLAR